MAERPHLPISVPHRLPILGREGDLGALLQLLDRPTTRLVTITGLGGIGKTRLAFELATRVRSRDVVVLELAMVTDASYVAPAIAEALSLPNGGSDTVAVVAEALRRRPTVLVLDNLEQLVGVQDVIERLLATVDSLVIVATSRLPLGMAGEEVWRTSPLGVPETADIDRPHGDTDGSVQMFRSVAAASDSRFRLDAATMEHVVEICRELGGHPLAIELAAARSARLGVNALRRELARDSTRRLSSVQRPRPERHRDLDSTIRWSYDRLPLEAARLFRLLSLFESWTTFDLVLAFTGELGFDEGDVAMLVESLVDHHLLDVSHVSADALFRLLPPVRAVASELLSADGSMEVPRAAHTRVMRSLARDALASYDEPGEHRWIAVLETARFDLAAALDRAIDDEAADAAAELASALARLWSYRRVFDVHRERIELAAEVARRHGADRIGRVRLHGWRLDLAALSGTSAPRLRALDADGPEPSLDPTAVDDVELAASMQIVRAYVLVHDLEAAWHRGVDALERVSGRDDRWEARLETIVGMVANMRGDLATARRLGLAALDRARRHGDDKTVVRAALLLAPVEFAMGVPPTIDLATAHDVARRLDDPEILEWLLPMLAIDAFLRGDSATAARHCADSFSAPRWGGVDQSTACAALLSMMCADREPAASARIHGMLADRWRALESHALPTQRAMHAAAMERVRERLGPAGFDLAVRDGMSLTWPAALEELAVIASSLASDRSESTASTDDPAPPAVPSTLTSREVEVLRHLAAGGTNKDIAASLGMRSKTVMHHAASIYRKLGVRRRTEAAAVARRLGLLDDAPTCPRT